MSKTNKFLLLALAIFVLFLISGFTKKTGQKIPKTSPSKPAVQTKENLDSKVSEGGNVTITVKPKVLKIGEKPVFEIEFETHSVDLSFDVAKQSVLVDDKGEALSQSVWDGSPPGGHHRSGSLAFSESLTQSSYVELIIKDVSGVEKRKFKWNLRI